MSIFLPRLHSPARIVQALTVQLGFLGDPLIIDGNGKPVQPWPVYTSNEPDTPDDCVTLYDTMGHDDGRLAITGDLIEFPGVSVRVRAKTYSTGYAKAAVIANSFDGVYRQTVTIDGLTYLINSLNRRGTILYQRTRRAAALSKRKLFSLNMTVCITRTS